MFFSNQKNDISTYDQFLVEQFGRGFRQHLAETRQPLRAVVLRRFLGLLVPLRRPGEEGDLVCPLAQDEGLEVAGKLLYDLAVHALPFVVPLLLVPNKKGTEVGRHEEPGKGRGVPGRCSEVTILQQVVPCGDHSLLVGLIILNK